MNAHDASQNSTPPQSRGRSMRELFIHYLKRTRAHYDEAVAIQDAYLKHVPDKYESDVIASVAYGTDNRWVMAVANQQFTERLANMYAQAAHLDVMNAMVVEQRETNTLLKRLCQKL